MATKLSPGIQYVGSSLQYVSPTGQILPVSAAPSTPSGSGTTPPPPPPVPPVPPLSTLDAPKLPSLAQLAANQAAITASATQGAAQAKTQLAAAKADQASVITGNTALATSLGATVDPKTGHIIPPAGGFQTPGGGGTNTGNPLSTLDATALDAYAVLEDAFNTYGLGDLIPVIKGYMANNVGPNEASLLIKQNPVYKNRFAGNYGTDGRVAKGLNALSESEYLALENSYNETLNAYGVGDYFGTTASQKQAGMASTIGGDISATEFQSRIKLVQDQVVNGDPQIKAQLKAFYNINDTDLMKYYLDPTQNLGALTMKTQAAEIGTAAVEQGLTTSADRAMLLAQDNVTQAQAQAGYATIGQELPIAGKLSGIYSGQINGGNYTQQNAEAEQFNLAGAASAARKKQQIQELEKANFNGRSGIVAGSASAGYTGSLGQQVQGKF